MKINFTFIQDLILIIITSLTMVPAANAKVQYFNHNGNQLAGYYMEPRHNQNKKIKAKAVLIFVHGDGAMPYNAYGYYNIVWNELRKNGYAIFSWDKPGVGNSQGNWLQQSMKDRQSEVQAAIEFVKNNYDYSAKDIGLIGFSQAGWVVPAIARKTNNIGFAIGIGFATNWVDQGEYYSVRKSKLSGEIEAQTITAIIRYREEIVFLNTNPSYKDYIKYETQHPMSQERFQFVLKNYKSDATKDYSQIDVPTLLIWGGDDENVDAIHEYNLRRNNQNQNISTKIIPKANHSLLNSASYKGQNFGVGSWMKLMWQDKEAFADGALEYLVYWLNLR